MAYMNAKTATALVSAMALATSAAAGAVPVLTGGPAHDTQATAQLLCGEQAESSIVKESNVQGSFDFDQSVRSSTADISQTFRKAAAVLCANLPDYAQPQEAQPISVGGDVDASFDATLSDLADEEGTDAYEMACSCASNGPGGGAIANAEVEGVSLASLADKAQAR